MNKDTGEQWFLMGDIHGEIEPIDHFYWKNRDHLTANASKNHIILLGDVGVNYALEGDRDFKFKRALSRYPFTYICLRGNHESRVQNVMDMCPDQWQIMEKYGGKIYVEEDFPQIEYLEDGPAVYEFCGYKTFSIPGAYSVDKWYRIVHDLAWFADEQLSEEEMELGRQIKAREKHFDLVISHTCPSIYQPGDRFIAGLDQSLVDHTMERYLGEIEYDLDYKRWAWGHFHADRLYPWNDGKQMLMLFHDRPVDLRKFMEMKKQDSLKDIVV